MNKYLEKIAGKLSSFTKIRTYADIARERGKVIDTVAKKDKGFRRWGEGSEAAKGYSKEMRTMSKMKGNENAAEHLRSDAIVQRIKSRDLHKLGK